MNPRPPALPRDLQRAVNKLAARRARLELAAVWRRHQAALQAAAFDMLLAGHQPGDVARELAAADCPAE